VDDDSHPVFRETPVRRRSSATQVLANQGEILRNTREILRNQRKILANQARIMKR